jgi:TRAP-type mannitol/chloroaromatic compound transport system permease small subunit
MLAAQNEPSTHWPTTMKFLLRCALWFDGLSQRLGTLASWAVFLSCFISCANAFVRFGFSNSSNAWLEIQWYLFAACVMLGAAWVLRVNEHVRVDILYGRLSARGKVCVDLLGLIVFLLPLMALMFKLSLPLFLQMLQSGEMSSNAGGLIRWPAMLMLPLGFAAVFTQGLFEIIKRIAWLRGDYEMNLVYERPLQ